MAAGEFKANFSDTIEQVNRRKKIAATFGKKGGRLIFFLKFPNQKSHAH